MRSSVRSLTFAIISSAALFSLGACGESQTEKANRGFVRLTQAVTEASAIKDPVARRKALVEASSNVDQFLKDYAVSDAAVRISANEKMGSLTRSELIAAIKTTDNDPMICRESISISCLSAVQMARFDAFPDTQKKVFSLAFLVTAHEAGVEDNERKYQAFALPSWTPKDHADFKWAPPGPLMIYAADLLGSHPQSFWKEIAYFRPFAENMNQAAFILGAQYRFDRGTDFQYFEGANIVVDSAPSTIQSTLKDYLATRRSQVIGKMTLHQLADSIERLTPEDMKSVSFFANAPVSDSDRERLIRSLPPQRAEILMRAMPHIDEQLLKHVLTKTQPHSSTWTYLTERDLRENGLNLPIDDYIEKVRALGLSGQSAVLARYVHDFKSNPQAAQKIAALYNEPKVAAIMQKAAIGGFQTATIAELKALPQSGVWLSVIPFDDLIPLMDGRFTTADFINLSFDWAANPNTFTSAANNHIFELNKHLRKDRPGSFTDDECRLYIKRLLNSNFSADKAGDIQVLRDRGLIAESNALEDALLKNGTVSESGLSEIWTPRIDMLIRQKQFEDAGSKLAGLNDNVKNRVLVTIIERYGQNDDIAPLLNKIASTAPTTLGHAISTIVMDGLYDADQKDLILLKYGQYLVDYPGTDWKVVTPYYFNALWRDRNDKQLSDIFFDNKVPMIAAFANYTLIGHLQTTH